MNSLSTTFLIVFCALLGSAFSHQCIYCLSTNSTVCNETEVECIGERCMTGSQYYHNDDKVFYSIYKGCANESLCGAMGSMTRDFNVKIRIYASCCTGNKCNTDAFQLPAEDPKPNGVKCPSCYSKGTTKECTSTRPMKCTGSEKQCINYRGTVSNPDGSVEKYSVKSCINYDGCLNNFNCLIKVEEQNRVFLKC
ncbi:protein RoBo-1-like [Rhinoderma darwinii]|uniref:protein RoBo-1-like n=1 Tax=Rhinoderma darwinii TaxID=43563 RepID=UPI003F66A91E